MAEQVEKPVKLVEISAERLEELEAAEEFLLALEAEGVDNWPGYELAIDRIDAEYITKDDEEDED
jgi:hypothetical protein